MPVEVVDIDTCSVTVGGTRMFNDTDVSLAAATTISTVEVGGEGEDVDVVAAAFRDGSEDVDAAASGAEEDEEDEEDEDGSTNPKRVAQVWGFSPCEVSVKNTSQDQKKGG
jgi:hypothetical protein